jgi:hypothetical protein
MYLCSDPGEPGQRCCDSIYRVLTVENYEDCSERAGQGDMLAFMDVDNDNANSCVSTNSTMMTFSNSCFDSAPTVMLGDCNTGIKECGGFTPISDVLDNCAGYLDYDQDAYYKCVETFIQPFAEGSKYFDLDCDEGGGACVPNDSFQTDSFITQQQRDALLCCADAYANDNAKDMKKCSSAATDDNNSYPKKKKKKGKDSRVRTRALRKMRGRMSKI